MLVYGIAFLGDMTGSFCMSSVGSGLKSIEKKFTAALATIPSNRLKQLD